MNKIYSKDFKSLEFESLKIDYLRFNLKSYLHQSEINNLAVYFRRLGFNSFQRKRDNIKESTPIFNDNDYEVTFVLKARYHKETHFEFPAASTNQLYFLIKTNKLYWNRLKQYSVFLRRIDTCYDRPNKLTDKLTNEKFLESTLHGLSRVFLNKNLEYKSIVTHNFLLVFYLAFLHF